ncbi:MAG TPA: hypothetical protein VMF89_24340, partial [Polyangiales bacterium]|nr:hypothetical protein [Polyangiales bacterium]
PRATTSMPDAALQPPAAGAPARPRRAAGAARAAKVTRAVAGSPSPKPREKPAAKRSRNNGDAPSSSDPFERLDNMTLQ